MFDTKNIIDAQGRKMGWFDSHSNETKYAQGRKIGIGNVFGSLFNKQ